MGRIEQALCGKLFLQLLKGDLQIADALRHDAGAIQLIGSVAQIYGNAAEHRNAHAVFRPEAQSGGAALEHDAAQAALAVLQRKIVVPGGIDLVVGQFAAHAHIGQKTVRIQQRADMLVELGDGEDRTFGAHHSSVAGCLSSSPRTKLPSTPLMKATVSGSS